MIELLARPYLLVLLALPVALLFWPRRRAAIPVGDGALPAAARGRSWIVAIPPALRAVALAAWVIAAAGPRLPGGPTAIRREGISIVIALDVSSSMLAEDFAPANRLEVAKRQAIAFIRGRDADRIGLVAFAGDAITQMPVTLDYAVLEQSVRDMRVGTLEDGTAIGSGLATAVNRLRRVPGTSRVVLLLTDGENNRGAIDPRTAANAAAAFGVKVYTVGVGTIGEARIPTGRGLTGFRYELLPVRIDEELLRDIASLTGGRYFRATDAESLSRIFQQIDALERTPFDERRRRRGDERPAPFLFAGLGLFAGALLLAATRLVRAP
jgi:Ca-activated chloride channel family protein